MGRRLSREQETRIVALADKLIETVISMNLVDGDNRAFQHQKGVTLATELSGLLADLLEGRIELLEELLSQLTRQRMPNEKAIKGYNAFASNLQEIIDQGTARYKEETREREESEDTAVLVPENEDEDNKAGIELETGEEATPASYQEPEYHPGPGDTILRALTLVFPGRQVIQGSRFHGIALSYYLPQEKLAVEVEKAQGSGKARLEYFCRREGIDLVSLESADVTNPWRAARTIRHIRRQN